ncbi:mitochondrial ribosome assembly protein RRG9 [Aspergillus clavatus NRRL 1]|uniref:Required for respiratory growth protein 9, mitochondrial n=1 Tax=Aspergillus clavatus (strain ATCC 1007 / CBS 513.65 / DSM 816 / NCTC 3887 / NRRL 1 / QM 1276 / 107) TaxID=344612 RepID=RRG9_ASPCL|nr:uncharacterized protein ACLA_071220 [Aspergillus clavatus NRRL 1]A1C6R8.1 RecName: Full=Required for respiratory growth protein 9, mitochondrial; Flags: Precursor [Aspergillus clavatus NRRL 1]EAW14089.1 conserved hypothetical protein [Aspergillus clavatus NRRL 1]
MSNICVASSKLNLPTLLRSVFRSEFTAELRPQQEPKSLFLTRPTLFTYRRVRDGRHFSSLTRSLEFQSRSPVSSHSSLLVATDVCSTPQPSESVKLSNDQVSVSHATDSTGAISTRQSANNKKGSGTRATPDLMATESDSSKTSRSQGPRVSALSSLAKSNKKRETWQIQKDALKKKFKEGWNPPKKLSPDALDGIRHLHSVAPDRFTASVLAEQFQVSPEAIRRILKSKWRPSAEEMEERRERWDRRHDRIWSQMTELGLRPKSRRANQYSDAKVLYDDSGKQE